MHDINDPVPEVVVYRFTRVIFGMNASQYLLAVCIRKHLFQLKETHDEVGHLIRSLFVDDYIGGADNPEEAMKMYARIKELLLQAGLELRKWCSNNVNVQKQILDHEPDDQVGKPFKHASKILGLTWDKTEDKLNIQTSNVYKESAEYLVSKRNVLKTVASLYDPIGVISPIVILFKLFFQKLVGWKCSWDEELPSNLIIE